MEEYTDTEKERDKKETDKTIKETENLWKVNSYLKKQQEDYDKIRKKNNETFNEGVTTLSERDIKKREEGLKEFIKCNKRSKEQSIINKSFRPDGDSTLKIIFTRLNTFFNQDCSIKFKLFQVPEYQVEGKIIYLIEDIVIVKLEGTEVLMQFNLEEINYHTIFPLEYNPLKYPKRGFISPELREHIFSRDNYQCQIRMEGCTNKAEEIDHCIPVARGGTEHPDNLQASCLNCNRKKSDKI